MDRTTEQAGTWLWRLANWWDADKLNSLAPGKFEWNFRYLILQIISVIDGWGISFELALRWMSLDLNDDKSTLVQVMAWCRQATSRYLSQCWPRSLSPYDVTGPQWVNPCCAEISWGNSYECIFEFFNNFSSLKYLKSFLMEDINLPIWHTQYHCGWWPGNARRQGISSHGIGLFIPEYSSFHIKRVNSWNIHFSQDLPSHLDNVN